MSWSNGFEDFASYSGQVSFGGRMWNIKTPFRYFCVVGEIKNFFSCIKTPEQPDGELRVHTDFSQWQVDSFCQEGRRTFEKLPWGNARFYCFELYGLYGKKFPNRFFLGWKIWIVQTIWFYPLQWSSFWPDETWWGPLIVWRWQRKTRWEAPATELSCWALRPFDRLRAQDRQHEASGS